MTPASVEDAVLPMTDHLWIWRELGTAQFGDARLTQRAMTIAQDLSAHPDQSLASIYEGNWGGLHAAYRFYDNPAVTPATILAPHFEATWDRSGEQPIVLIAQDTTYFNYSSHKAFQGGGPIESLNDKGILVHSALAMTPQGVCLSGWPRKKYGTYSVNPGRLLQWGWIRRQCIQCPSAIASPWPAT